MCRICTVYNKVDLKQIAYSNPFAEELDLPDEAPVPTTIVVDSPESRRYTAWRNLPRFPSLSGLRQEEAHHREDQTNSISIYGPRGMSNINRKPVAAYQPYRQPARPSSSSSDEAPIRKLHHTKRIESFPRAMGIFNEPARYNSTPESTSPVSEAEAFYLPPVVPNFAPKPLKKLQKPDRRALPPIDTEVPVPGPLRVRNPDPDSAVWMAEACRNF